MAIGDWRIYPAKGPISDGDIRALREFLEQTEGPTERLLHDFLIRHPALIGALDFVAFASELALSKRDDEGRLIARDRRRRNRADLLAARQSAVTRSSGEPFISAHLIELKGPRQPLVRSKEGARLTDAISQAVNQLHDYHRDLTQVPENVAAVRALGWEVQAPSMFLVAGSEREFRDRPAQLETVRDELLRQQVCLVLLEDLLRAAEHACVERRAFDIGVCSDLGAQRLLSFSRTILDLSSKRVFPENPPPKPQFDRKVQLAPDGRSIPIEEKHVGHIEAMSVVEKYVFQATPDENTRVREAGARHIETLFTEIWRAACRGVRTVAIVDPVGHSWRSRAIWLGESTAKVLGLTDAWLRWHESRFAPEFIHARSQTREATVLRGFNCVCGTQHDLDPVMAREIRSFECRSCGRTIATT
jgi:hypothetical protein